MTWKELLSAPCWDIKFSIQGSNFKIKPPKSDEFLLGCFVKIIEINQRMFIFVSIMMYSYMTMS